MKYDKDGVAETTKKSPREIFYDSAEWDSIAGCIGEKGDVGVAGMVHGKTGGGSGTRIDGCFGGPTWDRTRDRLPSLPLPESPDSGRINNNDPVNSPAHYKGKGGLEVIDVIDAFELDLYQGSIVQYLIRYKRKDGIQDLRKAKWYLDRLIATLEKDVANT